VTVLDWREANAAWLCARLDRLRLQLQRRALWLRHRLAAGGALDAEWLVRRDETAERHFYGTDPAVVAIDRAIAEVDADLDGRARAMPAPPALVELARACGLSPFEADVLLLVLASALDASFERMFAALHDDAHRPYPTVQLALGVFVDAPADRVLQGDVLAPWRPLRRLALVEVDDGARVMPANIRRIAVADRVLDHLRGVNAVDERLAPFLRRVPVPLVSTEQEEAVRAAVRGIRDGGGWPVVNLVGSVEAGARDVAAAACAAAGLRAHALNLAAVAALGETERGALLPLLAREAILGGLALVVDADAEGDGDPHRARAAARDLVERLSAVLVVISHERWAGDGAAHVVPVPRPDRSSQRALWRKALDAARASVYGELEGLTQQFDLGAPAIAEAVRVAADLARRREGDAAVITAADVWDACRHRASIDGGALLQRVTPCYGWEDIVLAADVLAQLRELASQVERRAHVYEAWGFGRQLGRGRAITALFSGPSGTGKTMAAEILANHLRLDLYRTDLSGVVSKYIGETEKNLRKVFDAADRSGAILFFDEADALFGTRTEVRDSHDRYANIEVNYLLQRMEDYGGLAILATNRKAALDDAFLRRLRFLVDFPFPAADSRRLIWERVFPRQAELAGVDLQALSRLEVAGGSIRSIAVNAAFLASAEGRAIGMAHVMRAARREYAKINRPLSAAEFGAYHAPVRA
jgi:hypothetical protein